MSTGVPDYIKENLKVDILPESSDSGFLINGSLYCDCKANDFYVFHKSFADKQSKDAEKVLNQKMKKYRAELKKGNDLCIIDRDNKCYLSESNTLSCKEILLEDITSLWDQIGYGHSFSIVEAVCPHCQKKISLFDSRIHGYNAMIEQDESIQNEDSFRPIFKPKICKKCGNDKFNVFLHISNTGREDLIRESNRFIHADNWENAFDWISVDVKCTNCDKKTKSWFEMETM